MLGILITTLLVIQSDSTFKDPRAREILERGRAARIEQDSTLTAYDALVFERLSLSLKVASSPSTSPVYRDERASRVQWQRGTTPLVQVLSSSIASTSRAIKSTSRGDVPIPYYPGRDNFGFGTGFVQADIRAASTVNPLSAGAEQYYTYATGDSLIFRLAGNDRVRVRELIVRPRKSSPNVVVGSLWFDEESGRLVRAVYKLAEPVKMQIPVNDSTVKYKWLIPLIQPLETSFTAVVVEYGLHAGKFWLPRTQALEGEARASFVKMPFVVEQAFRYTSVNGSEPVIDSTLVIDKTRHDSTAKVYSTELPSIFDPTQDVFGEKERAQIIQQTLTPGVRPVQVSNKTKWSYGFPMTRYNKIEGLSIGVGFERKLNSGYTARGSVRTANADPTPNFELNIEQDNVKIKRGFGAYRRLVYANDWGTSFNFGKSIDALLFTNDDGVYYRAVGTDLSIHHPLAQIRFFIEHQSPVKVNTQFSLARSFGSDKKFSNNIIADRGNFAGIIIRRLSVYNSIQRPWNGGFDLRLEAATGNSDYTRAAFDADINYTFARIFIADLKTGVGTSGGGGRGGTLPTQRLWYLGSAETVRGQPIGSAFGNSFWMAKGEFGLKGRRVGVTTFGDLGWAGNRDAWSNPGRPLAGAGVGVQFFGGIVRLDLAKGIYPEKKWRAYSYIKSAL